MNNKEIIPDYETVIPKGKLGRFLWNLECIVGFIMIAVVSLTPPAAITASLTYKYKPFPQSVQQPFDRTIEYFTSSYQPEKSLQIHHS